MSDDARTASAGADPRAEKLALRASELSYRRLFEAAQDGILILDFASGRIADANPFLVKLLGFSHEEMLGRTVAELSPFKDIASNRTMLEQLQQDRYVRYEHLPLETRDGRRIAVEFVCNVYPAGDQEVIQCNIRDITQRVKSEARFRRLVESNVQGVFFWNTRGEITQGNDAFLHLVGYTREDLAAARINWIALTPPEYAHLDRRGLAEVAATGACKPYEKEFLRKNGTRAPVLLGAASFLDEPSEGVCFVLDLTEQKKLEQQYLRVQRMESIGTLAGGIAHDLNNILAPIIMAVELLNRRIEDPQARGLVGAIEASAKRAAEVVRQILSFVRGLEGQRIEVRLKDLLQDLENIIRNTFPKDVRLQFTIPPDIWSVLGDPTQVHQVLLNLCVNARDAMPKGGHLTIHAENAVLDEHYAAMNVQAKPGRYVNLIVTDSGTGMPPEVSNRIFEPFFTTKDLTKGTGLGLSTVMAIVKSHEGVINVYSEPGHGTRFNVYLPAMPPSGGETNGPPQADELPRGHGETILVVDDEVSILNITAQTLRAFGYKVLTAGDGAEAVAVYAEYRRGISAALIDMSMPIMDGPAAIRALMKINPAIRIIGVSGLNIYGDVKQLSEANVRRFLTKPFTAGILLTTLRAVLAG
jgi:PAS domain S-box-containing protein